MVEISGLSDNLDFVEISSLFENLDLVENSSSFENLNFVKINGLLENLDLVEPHDILGITLYSKIPITPKFSIWSMNKIISQIDRNSHVIQKRVIDHSMILSQNYLSKIGSRQKKIPECVNFSDKINRYLIFVTNHVVKNG